MSTAVAEKVVKLEMVKEDKYSSYVKHGLDLLKQQNDTIHWQLGELASEVSKEYGKDKIGEFAKDLKVGKKLLEQYRYTMKQWPQKDGRPSFWIAYYLNAHPQRAQIFAKNPDITVKEARERMKAFNQKQQDKAEKEAAGSEPAIKDDDDKGLDKGLLAVITAGSDSVKRALKYIDEGAMIDQKVMDAITDVVDSWKTLLDQAVSSMENQS